MRISSTYLIRLGAAIGRIGTGYFYQPERPMVWHPIYNKKWCQAHDYPWLTQQARRQVREEMLPDEWTGEVYYASGRFWENSCAACGARGTLQYDHLVPVAHLKCPGSVPSNLVLLCPTCNYSKSYHDFAAWYRREFGESPQLIIDKIHDWQYYCFQQGWN